MRQLEQKLTNGGGVVMHVLPCSFMHSRFQLPSLEACVRSSLAGNLTAASLLRQDLPNAIYTGGRLGGNLGGGPLAAQALTRTPCHQPKPKPWPQA